jgi:hypothetical protein
LVANVALHGTAERAAKKCNKEKDFLQRLKPVKSDHFTSGLKPRPLKEKTFSAACEDVPLRNRELSHKLFTPLGDEVPVDSPGSPGHRQLFLRGAWFIWKT